MTSDNVELPSLHPGFGTLQAKYFGICCDPYPFIAIPTVEDGGNHTPAFTDAAATEMAHEACLDVSKALAATAIRVVLDDDFYQEVCSLNPLMGLLVNKTDFEQYPGSCDF